MPVFAVEFSLIKFRYSDHFFFNFSIKSLFFFINFPMCLKILRFFVRDLFVSVRFLTESSLGHYYYLIDMTKYSSENLKIFHFGGKVSRDAKKYYLKIISGIRVIRGRFQLILLLKIHLLSP